MLLGNCDFNALSELRNLKSRIEELESEIRERDEEVRVLKENAQQKLINGEDSDSSKVIFEELFGHQFYCANALLTLCNFKDMHLYIQLRYLHSFLIIHISVFP